MIWTVTPSGTYLTAIQEDMDGEVGTALTYTGTLAGAYALAGAELAFRVDQGVALAVSTMLLDTTPAVGVVARAIAAGLTPGPATYSRYTVQLAGTGTLLDTTLFQGGGPEGRSQWSVVTPGAYSNGADVVIQAVDPGPVAFVSGVTTLTLATPVTGVTGAEYDSGGGDPFQLGADAESTARLRVRTRSASRGGGYAAVVSAIRDLSWVVAVDARQGPSGAGYVAISVAPAPVGADQEAELAALLYGETPPGSTLEGSDSLTTTDVNGETVTVYYTEGTTEAKAIVVAITGDGTVSASDLEDAAEAAIEAEFALLGPGDPIYRLRLLGGLDLPGTTAVTTLTVGGSTADSVSPASAVDVLIPSPITVTATVPT